MDFCRNVSVSGGLYSEYQPEQQVLSPTSSSKLGSLDDLFSGHPLEEGDVNLEWLSIFVEDCLSSSGNCLPPAAAALAVLTPTPDTAPSTTSPCATNTNSVPKNALQIVNPTQLAPPQPLQKFAIPGKARSKRKRSPLVGNTPFTRRRISCWSQAPKFFTTSSAAAQVQDLTLSSDPPLLQQAYWLADSELILPKKEDPHSSGSTSTRTTTTTPTSSSCSRDYPNEKIQVIGKESREKGKLNQEHLMMMVRVGEEEEEEEGCHGNGVQGIRRCTHCLSQRTPQWRAGPLGPKTLCNACGVRYKSGRLLPEYRPAKSPTFVSYKHSNSHKKVLEMRSLSHLSSPSSSSS